MSHINPAANVGNIDCRVETSELTLTPLESSPIWIRSDLPVASWADVPAVYLSRLSEALAEGVVVKRDPSRHDFFDVVIDDTWMYFHIARRLRTVYVVAIVNLNGTGVG
jgi:hypothetical protein